MNITKNLCISGIYPHLAAFNGMRECGIGAIVSWADKLWLITYSPHEPQGSPDKLYSIDKHMNREIHPKK